MTAFDDEVDPFETRDATPSHYLEEDVDDFEDETLEDDDDDLDEDELDDSDESDEDDDDLDDLDDATPEEVDLVLALYREDGHPVGVPLAVDLANDLDEFITQLRRIPGDGGAIGMVSVAGEFFVLCRVRGRTVQVLLSDAVAANDWPIARDVADYLGEDIPDPDDDSEPMGDAELLVDLGVAEFDMEAIADDLEEDSDELLRRLAVRLGFGPQFEHASHATPQR